MYEKYSKEELIKIILDLENKILSYKEKIDLKSLNKSINENKNEVKEFSYSEKIKIFMELFKGRQDIYATMYINKKTGKTGYSPVCKNKFRKYKCDITKTKCNDCIYRELLPITEKEIEKHLKGEITIGIYPLLQDNLCNFLAIDFDKKSYEKDVIAFVTSAEEYNIPVYIEKSRSGNGAHVWIFFSESVEAYLARKMGAILLTKAMEKEEISLSSYDRLFPNQDIMPKGGMGNLIALPFQRNAVQNGNTVFVNKYFEPYENQINILFNVNKINKYHIEEFVNKNKLDDFELPTIDENDEDMLPKNNVTNTIFTNNIECIINDQIYIKKLKLLPNEVTYLKRLASFTNPRFYELQKLRMPVYNTPRIIMCYEEDDRFLILPRGLIDDIKNKCLESNVKLVIKDTRVVGDKLKFNFNGKLLSKQKEALETLILNDIGVLSAATGFGKTVIGASIITNKKTNTLILVHRQQLLEQWKERLQNFLSINKKEIGQIGGGKDKQNGKLDIALIQSLFKKDNLEDILKNYGLVIIDECHHVSAFSFEKVLKTIKAKYVYGLTATPIRSDGFAPIIYMQCGKIRYKVTSRELSNFKKTKHEVIIKSTNYQFVSNEINNKVITSEIYNDMINNSERNNIIIQDVIEALLNKKTPLILTERIEHIEVLIKMLSKLDVSIVTFRGGMGKNQKEQVFKTLKEADENNKTRLIIATASSIGEGFDDSKLDTLFLTMPLSWKGRIIQYVGRLNREHEGKDKVVVYDYVDNMKILKKMFEKRKKGYKIAGYDIKE